MARRSGIPDAPKGTFQIKVQKPFFPGGSIQGRVGIDLDENAEGDLLRAVVVGTSNIAMPFSTGRTMTNIFDTKEIFWSSDELATFSNGEMVAGAHCFPFSIDIPKDLPPSVNYDADKGRPRAAVMYRLRILLGKSSSSASQSRILREYPLTILPPRPEFIDEPRENLDVRSVKIASVINRGSLAMRMSLEKCCFWAGDIMKVNVALTSRTSASFHNLKLSLLEVAELGINGHTEVIEKKIVSTTVDLSATDNAPIMGNGKSHKQMEVLLFLQDGIKIPSMNSLHLKVSHEILLEVKPVNCGYSTLKSRMPILFNGSRQPDRFQNHAVNDCTWSFVDCEEFVKSKA